MRAMFTAMHAATLDPTAEIEQENIMRSTTTLRDRFAGLPVRFVTGLLITAAAAGCSSDKDVIPSASSVAIISGNNQTATVATSVSSPLVIQVKDQNGNPMSGVTVTFTSTGGATLGSNSAVTDASGNASTTVTLGNTSGAVTVTATANGISTPAVFSITSTAAAAASLTIVSGNNQSAAAGTSLAAALVAKVTDQYGNAIAGATIDWTTTGGTLAGSAQSITDATGTVSTGLQLPATAGTVLVTGTVHGTAVTTVFTETAM